MDGPVLTAYRDLDALAIFETASNVVLASQAPTRFAVRQVLDQELQKTIALRENALRQARFRAGNPFGQEETMAHEEKENKPPGPDMEKPLVPSVKRDFFGRVIETTPLQERDANSGTERKRKSTGESKERKIWVTFHEGLNNAVRKPISLQEFLRGL